MNTYEIRVQGQLDQHWSEWLGGLSITYDSDNNTILNGSLIDEAELHSVLMKIGDLGVPLLTMNRIIPEISDRQQSLE